MRVTRLRRSLAPDHEGRRTESAEPASVADAVDATAVVLYAEEAEHVVGTARVRLAAWRPWLSSDEETFELERLGGLLGHDRVAILDQVFVAPEVVGMTLASLLYGEAYQRALSLGAQVLVCAVPPSLVPVHRRLGFSPYRRMFLWDDAGQRVPMLLCMRDIARLQSVGSPLLAMSMEVANDHGRAAQTLSTAFGQLHSSRMPGRAHPRTVWAMLADGLVRAQWGAAPRTRALDDKTLADVVQRAGRRHYRPGQEIGWRLGPGAGVVVLGGIAGWGVPQVTGGHHWLALVRENEAFQVEAADIKQDARPRLIALDETHAVVLDPDDVALAQAGDETTPKPER